MLPDAGVIMYAQKLTLAALVPVPSTQRSCERRRSSPIRRCRTTSRRLVWRRPHAAARRGQVATLPRYDLVLWACTLAWPSEDEIVSSTVKPVQSRGNVIWRRMGGCC
jgi:hypothetical protein